MDKNKLELKREDIYKKLEEVMMKNPVSVRQLAKETGISIFTLHNFFKGHRNITLKTISLLERYIQNQEEEEEKRFLKRL